MKCTYIQTKNDVVVIEDHITVNRKCLSVVCDTTDGVVHINGRAKAAYCGWVPVGMVTLETIYYRGDRKEIEYDNIEELEAAISRFKLEGRWGL
jgi:hypothetical protein